MSGTKIAVECPYKDKCIDVGSPKCSHCLNNSKRSYYRPSSEEYPYYLDYPWYPNFHWYYFPYYWDTTTAGSSYSSADNT